MIYAKLWLMSLALVGIRAFQQKNVMGDHYMRIVPTSYAFALFDLAALYFGLQEFETAPVETVLAMGTGAWMGCWISMRAHARLNRYVNSQ